MRKRPEMTEQKNAGFEPLTHHNDHEFFEARKVFCKRNMLAKIMVVIKPDRPFDKWRYESDEERRRGDAAMEAWFEYAAFKKYNRTVNLWRRMLKSGKPVVVPCASPSDFDLSYEWSRVLPENFWVNLYLERLPLDRRYDPSESDRTDLVDRILGNVLRNLKIQFDKPMGEGDVVSPPPTAIPWEERAKSYLEDSPKVSPELANKLKCPWG